MIRYIIVDDEHIAHDIVRGYCDSLPHLTFLKDCYDAIEAMEFLREHKVDLIFLDINMPKLDGFSFLKTLSHTPKVIVTSAYKEYALEGYELDIVDYLLKPFSFERFLKAINKIDNPVISADKENIKKEQNRLLLRTNKKTIQITLDHILFIESSGNYVKIVLQEDEIQIRERISAVYELLPSTDFIQVHKSFIVSKAKINSIEGNRIRIKDFTIPIGKTYKQQVNALFG